MSEFVGTQVEIEREALRLLARDEVRTAVAALAERWRAGTPGFASQTYAQLPACMDEVALLVALQVVNGDPRRPRIVEISAGPHEWGGLAVPGGRWGINNPDTLYFAAPIEPRSGYVLRGRRRGTAPTDLNVSVQVPDVWQVLDSLGLDDLGVDADGGFVIRLGDHDGHLPIRDGGGTLIIRQTLGDWSHELPYDLTVERVDGPDLAPPTSTDHRADQLVERLGTVIDHSLQTLQPPIFGLEPNTIPQPGPPGERAGYLTAQRNTLGHFRLTDDEALVVTVSRGGAGYVAVAATSIWGVTTDSGRHPNSLNSIQAVLDPDGRMTVVVAHVDPGVPNWIDPGGLHEGIVMLRWQLLDRDPGAHEPPGVEVRQVHTTELPPPTVDPAARRQQVSARRTAYSRRFSDR